MAPRTCYKSQPTPHASPREGGYQAVGPKVQLDRPDAADVMSSRDTLSYSEYGFKARESKDLM